MRQVADSLREARAKGITSIPVGTANYFLQKYDPASIADGIRSWTVDQLYNHTMHWSLAHVSRYCLEMQVVVQLSSKLDDGVLKLDDGIHKSKRYVHGTFKQLLKELRRKVFVHNRKLTEIYHQAEAIMQSIQSEREEGSTEILTYAKMSVDFDEFREYHKVLASARILQDVDWLNSDLTTHPGIL